MKVELRYPHIEKNAPPSVQTEQMRTYLFYLVEQLQMVINNLPDNNTQNESQGEKR